MSEDLHAGMGCGGEGFWGKEDARRICAHRFLPFSIIPHDSDRLTRNCMYHSHLNVAVILF